MKWLLCVLIMSGGYTAWSDGFERGFVQLSTGERLYVEHKRAKPGHKTLFLANGLTYSTTQWQAYVTRLLELMPDLGIVLYDMDGQGQTLLDRIPDIYGGEIPLIKQVQDLNDLRHKIKVEGPSILAGLSYGGAVALR
jgi:pimeloyl-ACP methyl ester carboxylesterase